MAVNSQKNDYDCGMHVLEIANQLMKQNFDHQNVEKFNKDLVEVDSMRIFLKMRIAELSQKSLPVSL